MDKIEELKKEIYEATFFEANMKDGGVGLITFDEIKCVLVDNKLTVVFPPIVNVEDISKQFQNLIISKVPELKKLMYDVEVGVWLSFTLHLDLSDDTFLFLFNWEDPVDLYSLIYNDETYFNELQSFPRHKKYVPSWWADRISYLS